MTRLLVTGADGFVGRWLVRAAVTAGHQVVAGISPEGSAPTDWLSAAEAADVTVVRGDLRDPAVIRAFAETMPTGVVHLAAVASGAAARQDPGLAWAVNAGATAALLDALAGRGQPRVVLVSTGEVYGTNPGQPLRETDPVAPISPYAASKVGAEVAALEVWRRTGLPVMVARPFPHTGPGQSTAYVYGAFAARLRDAARRGTGRIVVGNLSPVRDLLDVRDVVAAYLGLLATGVPGEAYNVASGAGLSLSDLLHRLAALLEVVVEPEVDPALLRAADLPVLIGDATKLRTTTGWAPSYSWDRTLQDLVHAQAD